MLQAIVSKKGALAREFHAFQRLTSSLAWCRQYLWNPSSSSSFTLSNWIQIDAWYRSRVLELPGLGVCLIPYLDMVNHSDDGANAYYNLTDDGDVVLLPIETEEEGNMLSIHTKNSTEIRIKLLHLESFPFNDPANPTPPCQATVLTNPLPSSSSPTASSTSLKPVSGFPYPSPCLPWTP